MNKEDVLLTPKDIVTARKQATFKKYTWNEEGAIASEFEIDKAAQRKLLCVLKGKCPHDKMLRACDCQSCMEEIEKELR
jgi:hypothetical protein